MSLWAVLLVVGIVAIVFWALKKYPNAIDGGLMQLIHLAGTIVVGIVLLIYVLRLVMGTAHFP